MSTGLSQALSVEWVGPPPPHQPVSGDGWFVAEVEDFVGGLVTISSAPPPSTPAQNRSGPESLALEGGGLPLPSYPDLPLRFEGRALALKR